ncbi:Uncharacterised protein [Candidatus Ornithobacterium hominis]|uniref:S-adenosyl-methyltransferase n=2 Tax=Candidatus Ornithobacterium hominis TaxID=2497989 RepID=A0A383TUS5_9FLAO|nr:FtsL-like putative cell division protein [Candidatus Ornithobacterium hominis]MCT7903640.1 FtsL-like putative cell division protein [Candidatus Ornithobacterium hominis]CAI9428866.1 S-adenosyl-methyltransferase [Candidatus Ornithobacterium hominis]SZD70978.1 Uncharacterised protein [Candidatus Ornithobacterium hominis]SZD71650.1 Uncharacterised protein [Candidatus Ornithobacterium hominis]
MSPKKKKSNISIRDILKGKFLVDDNSFKHWKFVLFLTFLAFWSILSSHWADKKVVEIKNLKEHVSNLKSESAYLHQILMQSKMESKVAEKVAKDNVIQSNIQPFLIVEK